MEQQEEEGKRKAKGVGRSGRGTDRLIYEGERERGEMPGHEGVTEFQSLIEVRVSYLVLPCWTEFNSRSKYFLVSGYRASTRIADKIRVSPAVSGIAGSFKSP